MRFPYLNVPDVAERKRLFLGMYALGCTRGDAERPEYAWNAYQRSHPGYTVLAVRDTYTMHIYLPSVDLSGGCYEPANSADHMLAYLKRLIAQREI